MKKLLFALSLFVAPFISYGQTISVTPVFMPQYGVVAPAGSQIMTVCRLKLSFGNSNANKIYRYTTGVSPTAGLSVGSSIEGAGTFFIAESSDGISVDVQGYSGTRNVGGTLISNKEFNTAATPRFGIFTTDVNGDYTGWFSVVLDNSTVASQVYFYVAVDGGNDGILNKYFYGNQLITLKAFNTNWQGGMNVITGTSVAKDQQIVILWDTENPISTTRPLSITWTEDDGVTIPTGAFSSWYKNNVDGVPGKWAAYSPNGSAIGVRRMDYYDGGNSTVYPSPQVQFSHIDNNGDGTFCGVQTSNNAVGSNLPLIMIDGTNVEKFVVQKITTLQRGLQISSNNPVGLLVLNADLSPGFSTVSLCGSITTTNVNPVPAGQLLLNSTGSLSFNGFTAATLPSYITNLNNLTVNTSGGVQLSADLIISGQLNISSGSLAIGANTLTFSGGPITPSNASLVGGTTSSIIFNGSSAGVFLPSSANSLKNITIANPIGVMLKASLVLSNDLILQTGGVVNCDVYSLQVAHDIVAIGTGGIQNSNSANGKVLVNGGNYQSKVGGGIFDVLEITSGADFTGDVYTKKSITLSTNIAGQKINIGAHKLSIGGTWGGNIQHVTGTKQSSLEFAGTTPQTIPSANTTLLDIGSLIINNDVDVTLASNIKLATSLELNKGTFRDGGNTITLAGDIKGSATHIGTGKIIMTGGITKQYISDATITNLDLNNALGFELNGTNTGATNIAGQLNLITGSVAVKDKGLYFLGTNALPVIRTGGNIELVKQSSLGFGNKTTKQTGAGTFTIASGLLIGSSSSPTRSGNTIEIGSFVINRTNPVQLNINQQFDLYKTFSLVDGNLILPNSYQFDLKSNSITETAMVDVVDLVANPGAKITYGSGAAFSIERYIPKDVDAGAGRRAYRDVSLGIINPTGTMFTDWQENAPGSPLPGIGILITGEKGTPGTVNPTTGLDRTISGSASARRYWIDPGTGLPSWINILNTKNIEYNGLLPYRALVRGDRYYDVNTSLLVMNNTTKLRSKGQLIIGEVTINKNGASCPGFSTTTQRTNFGDDGSGSLPWTMIANPYAAPISWFKIKSHNPGITSAYRILDPNLNALGDYVDWIDFGNGTGSKTNGASAINDLIQPGQAFFITNNGSSNVTFTIKESDKVIDPSKLTAVFKTTSKSANNKEMTTASKIEIGLIQNVNSEDKYRDAAIVLFDTKYSNNINGDDIEKWFGGVNNIAITRTKPLSAETRSSLKNTDTFPIQLSGLTTGSNYKIAVDLASGKLNDLTQVVLKDNYLNKEITMDKNAQNTYDFQPTSSAATYSNRFALIFKTATVLAAEFFTLTGYEKNKGIILSWDVSEKSVKEYIVKHSLDGKTFSAAGVIIAKGDGSKTYDWFDNSPSISTNYYRIEALNINGSRNLSNVIKVTTSVKQGFKCFPNPAKDYIQMQFTAAKKEGTINIRLFNATGQLILTQQLAIKKDQSNVTMTLPVLPTANYSIEAAIEEKVLRQSILIKQNE
jgi:hypothetical protein